jgi:hypothetical protein
VGWEFDDMESDECWQVLFLHLCLFSILNQEHLANTHNYVWQQKGQGTCVLMRLSWELLLTCLWQIWEGAIMERP